MSSIRVKLLQMGWDNFTSAVMTEVFTSLSLTLLTLSFPAPPAYIAATLSIQWLAKPTKMWIVFS